MDAKRKKTLEDFMAAVPEEELISEKPLDTISLDEPTRHIWITIVIYLVAFGVLAGVTYTGYRVYTSEKKINAEEKIEGSILTEKKPVEKTEEVVAPTVVYVNSEGGLNLRETASTDAAVLELIPDKTKLTVIEEKDGWIKVTYLEKTGWSSKELTSTP
jgi:uncharacterized protein YgiM (DUF1202 family)